MNVDGVKNHSKNRADQDELTTEIILRANYVIVRNSGETIERFATTEAKKNPCVQKIVFVSFVAFQYIFIEQLSIDNFARLVGGAKGTL